MIFDLKWVPWIAALTVACGGSSNPGVSLDGGSPLPDGGGNPPGPDGSVLGDGGVGGDSSVPPTDGTAPDANCGANLQTDPNNCGACGHSCQGGTCTAAACSAVTLTTGPASPFRILVDSASIYWVNLGLYTSTTITNSGVMKIALSGGPPVPLSAMANAGYNSIAQDAAHIFASADGATTAFNSYVISASKTGGTATTLYSANSAGFSPGDIVSDAPTGAATTLFFVDFAGGAKSLPAAGGTPTILNSLPGAAQAVAFDGTDIYFALQQATRNGPVTELQVMTPLAQLVGAPYGKGAFQPILLAATPTDAYFTGLPGSLVHVAQGAASETVLAMGVGPYGVVADDNAVFWTDRGGAFTSGTGWAPCAGKGTVHMMKKGSTADITLASGLDCPAPIALDATTLYWGEIGTVPRQTMDGKLRKLAKPL